jgi:uncharacterized repeat protein (TIGR01451 family)
MLTKVQSSRMWLFWTGLSLVALAIVVLLAGGLDASQAQPSLDVEVSMTVNVPSVLPGQTPAPVYTVTFTNLHTETVVLDVITDTLPAGFMFIAMHASSDYTQSPLLAGLDLIWNGPITIPVSSTLSLIYSVFVPSTVSPSATPYVNTVTAMANGTLIGPATAGLLVGETDLALGKTAWPNRVANGEVVTYTVVLTNSGYVTGTVDWITDTMDPILAFLGMTADSEVTASPQEISSTLVWTDSLDVPPLSTLTMRYLAAAPDESEWENLCNQVDVLANTGLLSSEPVCITVRPTRVYRYLPLIVHNYKYPAFTINKSATPTSVTSGSEETIVYTVTIVNEGSREAAVQTVYDTLPAGFTFVGMEAGSDVTMNPNGTKGTITWTGPFAVPAGGQIQVIYRVSPSSVIGDHVNSANLTALGAILPSEPATATITVKSATLLEEHFNDNIDSWTPFLNYWRLKPGQWYWEADDGYNSSGGATQDYNIIVPKEAEDALLMYLAPGSENWTDYRVETKMILRTIYYPHGLWVRGQYQDVGDADTAGWVTGYYIMVGGGATAKTHYMSLKQMQTLTDCWDAACTNPENLYDFNNPHELTMTKKDGALQRWHWYTLTVEVSGNRIKAWLDGDLYIDYVDEKEPFLTGTIGLKTFKADTVSFDDVIVTPIDN